jgi:hypothetical protein
MRTEGALGARFGVADFFFVAVVGACIAGEASSPVHDLQLE